MQMPMKYRPHYNGPPIGRHQRFHFKQEEPKKVVTFDMETFVSGFLGDPFEEESYETNYPFFPEEILKLTHEIGYIMLRDDAHDIGKLSYPGHNFGMHHWQMGALLIAVAQICGMVGKMKQFAEIGKEFQNMGNMMPPPPAEEPIRVSGRPVYDQRSLPLPMRRPTIMPQRSQPMLPPQPQKPAVKKVMVVPSIDF